MLELHKDSHTDHHLTPEQRAYLLGRFHDRNSFFIETVELPPDLGTVPCGLHGPLMGDAPIGNDEAYLSVRGQRTYASRVCWREMRPTNKVTVIAGAHDGRPCVLFTAFGGPLTPKEPGDPSIVNKDELATSQEFWAQHALSVA